MLEQRKKLIDCFKIFNKRNPSNQESEFFLDFLLKYCPNRDAISDSDDSDNYLFYFQRKFDKVRGFPVAFRISLDYLAEHPEQLIGIVRGEQYIYYYFQPSPEVLIIAYFTCLAYDSYEIDADERAMIGTFSYFQKESLEKVLTDFRERGFLLDMPDLKPALVGGQAGGFGFR